MSKAFKISQIRRWTGPLHPPHLVILFLQNNRQYAACNLRLRPVIRHKSLHIASIHDWINIGHSSPNRQHCDEIFQKQCFVSTNREREREYQILHKTRLSYIGLELIQSALMKKLASFSVIQFMVIYSNPNPKKFGRD